MRYQRYARRAGAEVYPAEGSLAGSRYSDGSSTAKNRLTTSCVQPQSFEPMIAPPAKTGAEAATPGRAGAHGSGYPGATMYALPAVTHFFAFRLISGRLVPSVWLFTLPGAYTRSCFPQSSDST